MNDFYRTRAGKQFFDHDLGRLIEAINSLSSAMQESNKIEEKKLLLEKKKRIDEKKNSETETE